jgi:hypothetical protein
LPARKGFFVLREECPNNLAEVQVLGQAMKNPYTSETRVQNFTLYNFIKIESALRGERPRPAQGKPLAGEGLNHENYLRFI